jgi:small subunit ribosomal protein S6
MPKYELMYILSSAVSDNDVPTISSEVDKFITDNGGKILSQEMMGKKKLAYPVKKTRNGFYIVQTFDFAGSNMAGLDNKLRSLESIIRYILVNLEDAEIRKAKDRVIQEKMRASRKPPKVEGTPSKEITELPEIKITESELEQKIEKALESEDLGK